MTEEVTRVSIWKYVCLFAIIYVSLIIAVGIVLALLRSDSTQGMNVGCLAVASVIVAYAFTRKHHRSFEGTEYWGILTGSIAVDLLRQLVPAIPMLVAGRLPIGAFVFVGALVSALHGLLLAFMYSSRMVSKYVPKTNP
jgi:hypothetical protein